MTATFDLPLCLVCKLTSPQPRHKLSNYKLTIDTNKPPCQLIPLFEDMFSQFQNDEEVTYLPSPFHFEHRKISAPTHSRLCSFLLSLVSLVSLASLVSCSCPLAPAPTRRSQAAHVTGPTANSVLCFQYWFLNPDSMGEGGLPTPVDATILVSKNTGRYRVQSESLAALWVVCDALVKRLKSWFDKADQGESLEVRLHALRVSRFVALHTPSFTPHFTPHFTPRFTPSFLSSHALYHTPVLGARLVLRCATRRPFPSRTSSVPSTSTSPSARRCSTPTRPSTTGRTSSGL